MEELLNTPLSYAGLTVPNRVVIQPMEGCDCETDGTPGALTLEKYCNNAHSGAGMLWFEATAVCPEGRTNPRQMMLTEENAPAFRRMLDMVRRTARKTTGVTPVLIAQLTHSGRQSIRPMIAYRNAVYEVVRPLTDDHIVTDEYLETLPERFLHTAELAREVGFDGVDIKSCHGYLLQEMLSAFNRPGRYGGSFENRTRLYLDCIRRVRERMPDYPVVTRLSVVDMIPKPWGFGNTEKGEMDLDEPLRLIGLLRDAGVGMVNVTLGNPYYNPHVNRPFRRGAYLPPESPETGLARFTEVEKTIKAHYPDLLVVGSGLSFYREELFRHAEKLLEEGVCDLVGFGRLSLAYPTFYADYLRGAFDPKKCCVACSKCTELMRHGQVSGCAVFGSYYKNLYKETVK